VTGTPDQPPILLINPNTSQATTDMMVAVAQDAVGPRATVRGATATRGPAMLTTPAALDAAATDVVEIGQRHAGNCCGIIVAAFGDPGAAALRERLPVTVIGIGEAAMREAAARRGRFAVVTTTPALAARIAATATGLGLAAQYAGTWTTAEDSAVLVADPDRLVLALAAAIETCLHDSDASAVIIGGGPLSTAAAKLARIFAVPVIAPVAAAARAIVAGLRL